MAIFGKKDSKSPEGPASSPEQSIQEQRAAIEKEKSTLERNRRELEHQDSALKRWKEELDAKEAELTHLKINLEEQQIHAKNTFIREQRAAFEDGIAQQLKELDRRDQELKTRQEKIDAQYNELQKQVADATQRDRELLEREINAEHGFAHQNQAALRELEKRLDECHALEQQLEAKEKEARTRAEALKQQQIVLDKRELELRKAQQERDEGYQTERSRFDQELLRLRQENAQKIGDETHTLLKERENSLLKIKETRMAELRERLQNEEATHEKRIKIELDELETKRKSLHSTHAKLAAERDELNRKSVVLDKKEDALIAREDALGEEVQQQLQERYRDLLEELDQKTELITKLQHSIATKRKTLAVLEHLESELGGKSPFVVLQDLEKLERENQQLLNELVERPTREVGEAYGMLKAELDDSQELVRQLRDEQKEWQNAQERYENDQHAIASLRKANQFLNDRLVISEAEYAHTVSELKRLQAAYERSQDREDRIKDITQPLITSAPRKRPIDATAQPSHGINFEKPRESDEQKWLSYVSQKMQDYGFHFSPRILNAFHTALKTSEWSPLTVLAGVSGTGKSELPRLYSHFGGINFLSVSVQPNWDSQEAMLGFFNSIDNKFDAEDVLRLLAQTQSNDEEHGLKDFMTLILLDEMNLAHVELYFAQFLSKLEQRRGVEDGAPQFPNLSVKLGAGIEPYLVPLGRNVLWTGTMNQDETTKSLSDKVLDRGTLVHFPRPITLQRRQKLKPLRSQEFLLPREAWKKWQKFESTFDASQITPYKGLIEEMSHCLGEVGRALGHRVWQSIEYYMANHPNVLEAQRDGDHVSFKRAMDIAFEDQLVQKVMPKLRGIETRGSSRTQCLDPIRSLLEDNAYDIVEDFDIACNVGYGQFQWSSANYLQNDAQSLSEETEPEDSTSTAETGTSGQHPQPSANSTQNASPSQDSR